MDDEAKHPVRTTRKSFTIIEALKKHDGARVTELADELEMGKSTVHSHLNTLQECGYVTREDDEYRLGLKFLDLGGYIRNRMELFETAEPEIKKLAQDTGELANLMTEENGMGVYLYRSKGSNAVDLDTYAGLRTYLHSTGLGKAILAYSPRDRVEEIIDVHGLPGITDETVTNRAELFEKLEEVREQGYAIDDGERLEGLRCVAAPVQTEGDYVVGAVSVSAPASRVSDERLHDEIAEAVCSAANVIELNLRY